MLITFHYVGVIIFEILRNRKRLKCVIKGPEVSRDLDEFQIEANLRFDPPVYRQRYSKVYEILLNEKWRNQLKKLVDFGCAEFGLFGYLKSLNIEQILFVDIDESLLQEKIGKIEPLLADRLRLRNCPLEVTVFRGSVTDPDYRLRKTDVVTAVELIEHLYPDTLDGFPYNIFSFVRPKLAIITTPNADFNVMFRRLQGFRHPDHKFEWTREQFEDWATNIIERFPDYVVNFYGIGEGPDNIKSIGCCSQAAVFIRKDILYENYKPWVYSRSCQCNTNSPCKSQTTEAKLHCNCLCVFCRPDFSMGVCTYLSKNIKEDAYRPMKSGSKELTSNTEIQNTTSQYNTIFIDRESDLSDDINPSYNIFYKLIQKIDFPYEVDPRSETEKLLQTIKYRILTFSHVNSRFFVDEKQRCEIPLKDIMYGDIEVSLKELRHLLLQDDFEIEKCIIQETEESEYCIISIPREMEDITSSSEVTDGSSSKSSECSQNKNFEDTVEHLSDWDEIAYVPKEDNSLADELPFIDKDPASSSPGSSAEINKSHVDALIGRKSPSPLDNMHFQLPVQDNVEYVETDQFDDVVTTPNLQSDDNKLHLKKTVANEKFAGVLGPITESFSSFGLVHSDLEADLKNKLGVEKCSYLNAIMKM